VEPSHKTLERLALRVIAFSQLAVKGLSSIILAHNKAHWHFRFGYCFIFDVVSSLFGKNAIKKFNTTNKKELNERKKRVKYRNNNDNNNISCPDKACIFILSYSARLID
jgi:hypothetical protein